MASRSEGSNPFPGPITALRVVPALLRASRYAASAAPMYSVKRHPSVSTASFRASANSGEVSTPPSSR